MAGANKDGKEIGQSSVKSGPGFLRNDLVHGVMDFCCRLLKFCPQAKDISAQFGRHRIDLVSEPSHASQPVLDHTFCLGIALTAFAKPLEQGPVEPEASTGEQTKLSGAGDLVVRCGREVLASNVLVWAEHDLVRLETWVVRIPVPLVSVAGTATPDEVQEVVYKVRMPFLGQVVIDLETDPFGLGLPNRTIAASAVEVLSQVIAVVTVIGSLRDCATRKGSSGQVSPASASREGLSTSDARIKGAHEQRDILREALLDIHGTR